MTAALKSPSAAPPCGSPSDTVVGRPGVIKPIPVSPTGNLRSALHKSTPVKTPPPLPRFVDLSNSAPPRVRFNTCGPGESPSDARRDVLALLGDAAPADDFGNARGALRFESPEGSPRPAASLRHRDGGGDQAAMDRAAFKAAVNKASEGFVPLQRSDTMPVQTPERGTPSPRCASAPLESAAESPGKLASPADCGGSPPKAAGLLPLNREILSLHRERAAGLRSSRLCLSMPVALRLRADCSAARLKRSFERLVARHPSLRTAYPAYDDSEQRVVLPLEGDDAAPARNFPASADASTSPPGGLVRSASSSSILSLSERKPSAAGGAPAAVPRASVWRRRACVGWRPEQLRDATLRALDDGALDPTTGCLFRATLLDVGVVRRIVGAPPRGYRRDSRSSSGGERDDDSDDDAPAPSAPQLEPDLCGRGSVLALCVHRLAADAGHLMTLLHDWRVIAEELDAEDGLEAPARCEKHAPAPAAVTRVVDLEEWLRARGATAQRRRRLGSGGQLSAGTASGDRADAEAYWAGILARVAKKGPNYSPFARLADRGPPPRRRETRQARVEPFTVDAALAATYFHAAREAEGASKFVALLAVYAAQLAGYSQEWADGPRGAVVDVCFGILVGHKNRLGIEWVVGDATSWVPVCVGAVVGDFRATLRAACAATRSAITYKDYTTVLAKGDLPCCLAKFETATCGSDFRGAEAWAEAALGFGGAHDHALLNECRKGKRFVDVCGAPLESLRPPSHAGYADEHMQLWVDEDPQPFHTWAAAGESGSSLGGRPTLATQAERHAGAVRYAVDRFDRKTAIRVAKDFERALAAAASDLARPPDSPTPPLPGYPPPPPKRKPLLGCAAGCFLSR